MKTTKQDFSQQQLHPSKPTSHAQRAPPWSEHRTQFPVMAATVRKSLADQRPTNSKNETQNEQRGKSKPEQQSRRSPAADSDSLSSDWELSQGARGLRQPTRPIALAEKLNQARRVNPLGLKDRSNS